MRNRVWFLCVFLILLAASGRILPALPLRMHLVDAASLGLGEDRFSPSLQELVRQLPAGERLAAIVHLNPPTEADPVLLGNRPAGMGRQQAVIEALQARASLAQKSLLEELRAAQMRGEAGRVESLWINNSILVEAGPPEPNLAVIGATDLWVQGNTGQGVTVAVLDTGVDATHPDLAGRYRGGTNSWFDPYRQTTIPYDPSGHGTWVTGVIVGDGTGNGTTSRATGAAPGAQFIAAKIFADSPANDSTAFVHLAFQWVMDPDGNPATPDAPQVVNNSWDFNNPGCTGFMCLTL